MACHGKSVHLGELHSGNDLMAEILELEVKIEFSMPKAGPIAH